MSPELSAPFLELNYYSRSRPESELFADLVRYISSSGGRATGAGLGFDVEHTRECGQFGSISDDRMQELHFGTDDVLEVISDPKVCVIQLDVINASGIYDDMLERVTYTSIPDSTVGKERHPIAIWTDGQAFEFDEGSTQAREYGLRAYKRFLELVQVLDPDYGAITFEETVPTVTELRSNANTAAFSDFYLSYRKGSGVAGAITKLFSGGYVEDVQHGVYVSSTSDFNPERKGVAVSDSVQAKVGELIANTYSATA